MADKEYTSHDIFHAKYVDGTPLAWFRDKMKASGFTEAVIDKAGFTLRSAPDDEGGMWYINIPYYTVDGVQTTFSRRRYRELAPQHDKKGFESGGTPGKYGQKKGSKNVAYWPSLRDQRLLINDASKPLIVCEGEFKAVACQSALMASGLEAAVVGVSGTTISKETIAGLKGISCMVNDIHRVVFIAMDWNARGAAKDRAEEAEYQLTKVFQALGASVLLLRWPLGEDAKGEQKLDDWLAAGGDISAAMRHTVDTYSTASTERDAIVAEITREFATCRGMFLRLADPILDYNNSRFDNLMGHLQLQTGKNKYETARHILITQPPEKRNEVHGRLFVPHALGAEPELYVYRDGKRFLNIAPRWPEADINPWDSAEFPMFMELLDHIAQDEALNLLKFIAHTARNPLDRPHKIIELVGGKGTGKSTFMAMLERLAGRYCAPIGTSITTKFNTSIANVLFGIAPDIPVHGRDIDVASTIKTLSGDDRIEINGKNLQPYSIDNYLRIFLAHNKTYFVQVTLDERRHVMLTPRGPLDPAWVAEFKRQLATPQALSAMHRMLLDVDLTDYNPHTWLPNTDALVFAQEKSADLYSNFLNDDRLLVKDVWTNEELKLYFMQWGYSTREGVVNAVPLEVQERGVSKARPIKYNGTTTKFRAVRNVRAWEARDNADWVAEVKKSMPKYAQD